MNTQNILISIIVILLGYTGYIAYSSMVKNEAKVEDINTATLVVEHKKEEANKKLVLENYQALFGDHDLSVLEKHWTPTYIQHNPLAADGPDALKGFVQTMINAGAPKSKLDYKRVVAEGDMVWVHLRMNMFGKDYSVIDIFRIEDGKIAEHWDVLQEVPAQSANNNTMF